MRVEDLARKLVLSGVSVGAPRVPNESRVEIPVYVSRHDAGELAPGRQFASACAVLVAVAEEETRGIVYQYRPARPPMWVIRSEPVADGRANLVFELVRGDDQEIDLAMEVARTLCRSAAWTESERDRDLPR